LLTGEALALDALGSLTDEVIWLQNVVIQKSELIISGLVDGNKKLMEEIGDLEREPGVEVK